MSDDNNEIEIKLHVPRSAFVMVAPPPATITQRNVAEHFGIPSRTYLDLLRRGRLPFTKLGKLRVAAYEDVRRVVTEGCQTRTVLEHPDPAKGRTRYFDFFTRTTAKRAKIPPEQAEARMGLKPLWTIPHLGLDDAINHAFGEGLALPPDMLEELRKLAKKEGKETIGRYFDITEAAAKRLLDGLPPKEKPPSPESIEAYRRMRREMDRETKK